MRAAKRALSSTVFLSLAALALGCSAPDREDDMLSGGSLPTSTGSGPTAGENDTGVKLDVSPGSASNSAGDAGNVGCSKADFLFVIDNSGSMQDEQQNLINSFPGFMSTIQDTLMAEDYHVMVVDTDASGGGSSQVSCQNNVCTCSPVPACCESVCQNFGGTSCNGIPCDMLPGGECDKTLGAGKIFKEDGTLCLDENGPRYLTEGDPDLGASFACIGEVGTFGDGNEQPMGAMITATSDPFNQMGGCNEGFLRDDAILVVTFITDEEDLDKSPGDPGGWAQALIAAKGGNQDAIVVLGLFGDTDQPNAVCQPYMDTTGAEPGPNLRAFVEMFGERGVVGSVCANDYTPFFLDAVDVIDLTCDEFMPEG